MLTGLLSLSWAGMTSLCCRWSEKSISRPPLRKSQHMTFDLPPFCFLSLSLCYVRHLATAVPLSREWRSSHELRGQKHHTVVCGSRSVPHGAEHQGTDRLESSRSIMCLLGCHLMRSVATDRALLLVLPLGLHPTALKDSMRLWHGLSKNAIVDDFCHGPPQTTNWLVD